MEKNRSKARIWDTDWLLLKPLVRLIDTQTQQHMSPSALFVDLGCGDMPYKSIIEQHGRRYIGADIGDSAELPIDSNGRVPLGEGVADAVLSIQVLEHVRDLDPYFAEIRRLLASDGTLFLSTHGSWFYHPVPEDHRRWTNPGLVAEIERHGFDVAEIIPILGPLATTTVLRLTGFAFFLRKVPIVGGLAAGLLSVLMNFRGLIEDAVTPEKIRYHDACVYFVRAKKRPA